MSVIKDILITEKSIAASQLGRYSFLVTKDANKKEISQAIEKQFGVHVISINIAILPRKQIKRGRATGLKSFRKKAIVTLKKGEKIPAFEFPVDKPSSAKASEGQGKVDKKVKEKISSKTTVVKREQGRVKV